MPETSAESRQPPFGQRRQLPSGFELHYLEHGSGLPVVFLHGSGPGASAYSNFKQNFPALIAAGYRAVLPDMVGFGYSDKPSGIDYTLDLFSSTILELLDALEIGNCVLVGNSLGGAVSLRIAIDHPDRVAKLVLMAPGGIESRETYFSMPGIQKMVSGFVGEGFDRAGLRRILELLVFDPGQVTDELVEERFNILATQPKDVLARMKIPDLTPELPKIRCPVLGFWGINDQFMPPGGYEKILRACPDSRFVMLSSCGHWAMVEHAAAFNRQVLDFLRS
jgi:4,5:9,10-diseco-3-hydroxy-5,9,17-trioxoandrosta-1(10),2-diene-4-oate hydrolase